MGVVNVTPDSFSDGGRFLDPKRGGRACAPAGRRGRRHRRHRRRVDAARAPRRSPSSEELRARAARCSRSSRDRVRVGRHAQPAVMRAAIDGRRLDDQRHRGARARPARSRRWPKTGCAVCLMHMQGEPATMQRDPHYDDVVARGARFLERARCRPREAAGIARERIVVDPGLRLRQDGGAQPRAAARACRSLSALGVPVLAGLSRKSTLGKITGRAGRRAAGRQPRRWLCSRCEGGATIVRVHDVRETQRRRSRSGRPDQEMTRKYFGTDGVRGTVGQSPITPDFVLRLGYAAGKVLARKRPWHPAVLIGKDTRISGYMLEAALEAGFSAAGVDVHLCGPMPTPAVAYLTRALRLSAGIVISASHNPVSTTTASSSSPATASSCPTRPRRAIEARDGAADGLREVGEARQGRGASTTPPGATSSSARAPSRRSSTCKGLKHRGRLRARRRLPRRAARVPRARRRRDLDRRRARRLQHQRRRSARRRRSTLQHRGQGAEGATSASRSTATATAC